VVVILFSVFILVLIIGIILKNRQNARKYHEDLIKEAKEFKSDIQMPELPQHKKKE